MRFFQLSLIVCLLFVCQCVFANNVITGEAVSDNINISISVVNSPSLTIVRPKNETYISNEVFLDYSVSHADSVKYNTDGSLNASISSPTTLFLSDGPHIVNLYALNTYGTTHRYRWFNINTSLLNVIYDDYKGTSGGASTDFDFYTYEELWNLSDVVLEQVAFGKIEFLSDIDVVNDGNASDGVVDLDGGVLMSKGRVSVDEGALPNFDVAANVYFYDLDMISPRLLRNGEVCPSSVCVNRSYLNGVYSFYVVGAGGEYFVEEAYVAPSGGTGGGGGGGSVAHEIGISEGVSDVGVVDSLSISVRQGDEEVRELVLKNEGGKRLEVEVSNFGLEDLLFMDDEDKKITLEPWETKSIYLNVLAAESIPIDNYLGKLIFRGDNIFKEVLVSIFVESKFGLFDLDVDIGEDSLVVAPGGYLHADIDIINLGELGGGNVLISYFLKSEGADEFVFLEEEIGVIETRLTLSKMFLIPEDSEDGDYVLHVRLERMGRVSGESAWFKVRGKSFVYEAGFWVAAILMLVWILWLKRRRREEVRRFLKLRQMGRMYRVEGRWWRPVRKEGLWWFYRWGFGE